MSEYLGLYQASVVANNDPLGAGRVTCYIPSVFADQTSGWCTPAYPTTQKPPLGSLVCVQFLNGDPSKGIYFSSSALMDLERRVAAIEDVL